MIWPYAERVHAHSPYASCTIHLGVHVALPEPVQVRSVMLEPREAWFEYDQQGRLLHAGVEGFRVTARGGRSIRAHRDAWWHQQFAGAPDWLIGLGQKMRPTVTVQLPEGTRWLGKDKETT